MKSTKQVVAENLAAIQAEKQMSNREVARRSRGGISDRYVGDILNGNFTLTVNILDSLATALDVPAYELIMPDSRLRTLVHHYKLASDDGKDYIERVARKEATYPTEPSERPRFSEEERPPRRRRKKRA